VLDDGGLACTVGVFEPDWFTAPIRTAAAATSAPSDPPISTARRFPPDCATASFARRRAVVRRGPRLGGGARLGGCIGPHGVVGARHISRRLRRARNPFGRCVCRCGIRRRAQRACGPFGAATGECLTGGHESGGHRAGAGVHQRGEMFAGRAHGRPVLGLRVEQIEQEVGGGAGVSRFADLTVGRGEQHGQRIRAGTIGGSPSSAWKRVAPKANTSAAGVGRRRARPRAPDRRRCRRSARSR